MKFGSNVHAAAYQGRRVRYVPCRVLVLPPDN